MLVAPAIRPMSNAMGPLSLRIKLRLAFIIVCLAVVAAPAHGSALEVPVRHRQVLRPRHAAALSTASVLPDALQDAQNSTYFKLDPSQRPDNPFPYAYSTADPLFARMALLTSNFIAAHILPGQGTSTAVVNAKKLSLNACVFPTLYRQITAVRLVIMARCTQARRNFLLHCRPVAFRSYLRFKRAFIYNDIAMSRGLSLQASRAYQQAGASVK